MMYRLKLPIFNKPLPSDGSPLDDSFRGIPRVQVTTAKNAKDLIPLIGQPDFDTSSLPIFDYFHLVTSDRDKKLWEWCKKDVHRFEGPYYPAAFSLFISPKVKDVLSKYVLPQLSGYVLSKLKYQGEKYDYYTFYCSRYGVLEDIIFQESTFQMAKDRPLLKESIGEYKGKIEDYATYQIANVKVWEDYRMSFYSKKIVLQKYYDFFVGFDDFYCYISKRLKNALEENGITGIEFVEETDIEFHFLETPPPIGNNL